MKLEKVLDNLNSFEKNSFLKIIDGLLSNRPKNEKEIDKILSQTERELKNVDNIIISKVFDLVKVEFEEFVKSEFTKTSNQLDVLIDLISREGNAIMKQDWFSRLYDKELDKINKKIKTFKAELESEKTDFSDRRKRDFSIYKKCLHTAYFNDEENNQDKKVTLDEQSILETLSKELGLSQEEVKLINYTILPLEKHNIDQVVNDLKNIGVIFYSKKFNTIYVPDEIVSVLRRVRGKDVADKYFRRVLKQLREPEINLVCRAHGIDWKGIDSDIKIKTIINEGISLKSVLSDDVHKPETTLTEKKKFINSLCERGLNLDSNIKGTLLEEKIQNLIYYFNKLEKEDKVGISVDGYESLLSDLNMILPSFEDLLRKEFEFQEKNILSSEFLLNFNLKPREIIELINESDLKKFISEKNISNRGDVYENILESYKDSKNLLLENYSNIAFRDINQLKENGIQIKESEIGIKFEDLTKEIFNELGFSVDDNLRQQVNTKRDKTDIIISLNKTDVIVVECKTTKDKGYNKFSAVSRQLKSYAKLVNSSEHRVVKSLLVAPEFSDEFIKECGLEYELNLSLITAETLFKILHGFRDSKLEKFPHNLLMRDVVIEPDRVLKAIGK